MTKLENFKRSMIAKEKAVEETRMQKLALVQIELEEYKRSFEAPLRGWKRRLCVHRKHWLQKNLHARVQVLEDELNASKYLQEQALQAQKSARAELLEVKKELRMLQVLHQEVDEGNAASAP
ncbi:hypothetical protein R1flu_010285 [Riccia fluitans]|uniref:Uncharacterized protein n=1 Tax=Riccia fluitans TaxID=41844 RepID=A0ABD1Z4N2_9MARC